jgi:hypothetical protein
MIARTPIEYREAETQSSFARSTLLRGGPRAAYRYATSHHSGKNVDRALRASLGVNSIIETSQHSLPGLEELGSPAGLRHKGCHYQSRRKGTRASSAPELSRSASPC